MIGISDGLRTSIIYDYESNIGKGLTKPENIRQLAKTYLLTIEEVTSITKIEDSFYEGTDEIGDIIWV